MIPNPAPDRKCLKSRTRRHWRCLWLWLFISKLPVNIVRILVKEVRHVLIVYDVPCTPFVILYLWIPCPYHRLYELLLIRPVYAKPGSLLLYLKLRAVVVCKQFQIHGNWKVCGSVDIVKQIRRTHVASKVCKSLPLLLWHIPKLGSVEEQYYLVLWKQVLELLKVVYYYLVIIVIYFQSPLYQLGQAADCLRPAIVFVKPERVKLFKL